MQNKIDIEGNKVNWSLLLERRFVRAAFTDSVTATEMVVARASIFTCISSESLLPSAAAYEATEGVVGATSGSSEGRHHFVKREFVPNVRFLGGLAYGEKATGKEN